MRRTKLTSIALTAVLALAALMAVSPHASAHCDTMDGPVVTAARQTLETGNLDKVLIWIPASGEAEVRSAFKQARQVRQMGPTARKLADRHFFETVVRVHRAGEGAPYTGLKPADTKLSPAIKRTDQALEQGEITPLMDLLTEAVRSNVREQFQSTLAKRDFDASNVDTGRAYVKDYVQFVHYAKRIYDAAGDPTVQLGSQPKPSEEPVQRAAWMPWVAGATAGAVVTAGALLLAIR